MNLLSSIVAKFQRRSHKVAVADCDNVRPTCDDPIVAEEENDWSEEKKRSLLKVKKLHPVITWEPMSPIEYLQPISEESHAQAVCKDYLGRIVDGEFFFFPPIGTILEVGLHTITVTFVPKKGFKYTCAEATKTIEVLRKKPRFAWIPPIKHIIYLTPLSEEFFTGFECELTGGTLEFSHSIGTILEVGTHKIVAAFTPSEDDSKNYRKAYFSIDMLVTGTIVQTEWILPAVVTQPADHLSIKRRLGERVGEALRYLDPLPKWLFCASTAIPDVEGIFKYDKQPGDILPAGYHHMHADFIPSDTRKFYGSHSSVIIYINKAPVELVWEKPLPIPHGEPLNEYVLNCSNTNHVEGNYKYDPSHGTVLSEGTHEITVHFEPSNDNYLSSSLKQSIKILPKRELKILWFEPEEIVHPEPLSKAQLNATLVGSGSKSDGQFYYEPPLGTILDAGDHILQVTFIPVKESFAVARSSVKIKVLQGQARLTWIVPEAILEGEALYDNVLNCRCTNVTEGKFTYDPPVGTILATGSHKLKASFVPSNLENFRPSITTVTLVVRERPRFSARLEWSNPVCEPLLYGNQLTTSMLNAQCNNAFGTFQYEPVAGTVLPVGNHRLLAKFTPDDPGKCLPGFIESSITILKRTPIMIWKPQLTEIVYGNPLDLTLLNAYVIMGEDDQRRIDGVFTYKPPLGTILYSGDHSLSCNFRPTDSKNIYSVSQKISLFVHRITPEILWEMPTKPLIYPISLDMCVPPPRCSDRGIKGHFEYRFDFRSILPAGRYTLVCHFYPEDIINYYGANSTMMIEIKPGIPTIAWEPQTTLIYGSPITKADHCNAYADLPGGSFVYDPPEGTFLSSGGNIKFTLTYTPDDVQNYVALTMTKYLQVEKRIPIIEWNCFSKLTYGVPLGIEQLNAKLSEQENFKSTLDDLRDSVFLYSPPLGTVLAAGRENQIRLDFIPSESQQRNYQATTKAITIEVIPRTPKIKWKPKSQHLVEGEALSEEHLNAIVRDETLNPGEFIYTPPLGTTLLAGRYLVELQFIPTYPENCRSVKMSLNFEVAKRPPKLVWITDPVTGKLKCIKEQVSTGNGCSIADT
jgi:hypothetical protein